MLHRTVPLLTIALLLAGSAVTLLPAERASAAPPTLTGEGLVAGAAYPGTTLTATCALSDPNTLIFSVSGLAAGVPSGSGPYPGTFTEQGTLTRDPATGQITFAATFRIQSSTGTVTGTKSGTAAGVGTIGCPGSPTIYTSGGPFPVSYTARIETPEGVFSDQGSAGVGICFNCGFSNAFGESFTSAEACVVETLAASTVADSDRRGRLDPAPFRRLRDDVLKRSAGGQRYVALYEAHSPEIVRLMLADPSLRGEILDGLLLWQTDLATLADRRGGAVTIRAEQVRAAEAVLDRLAATGSPGLRQAIEQERRAHPSGRFVGMPLDRVLDQLTRGQSEGAR